MSTADDEHERDRAASTEAGDGDCLRGFAPARLDARDRVTFVDIGAPACAALRAAADALRAEARALTASPLFRVWPESDLGAGCGASESKGEEERG